MGEEEMTTIKVEKKWLETLAEYAREAEQVINAPLEHLEYRLVLCKLIGFASSARTILKYGREK
jgi:hypothetical protein